MSNTSKSQTALLLSAEDFFDLLDSDFADTSGTPEMPADYSGQISRVLITTCFEQTLETLTRSHRQDVIRKLRDTALSLCKQPLTLQTGGHSESIEQAKEKPSRIPLSWDVVLLYRYVSSEIIALDFEPVKEIRTENVQLVVSVAIDFDSPEYVADSRDIFADPTVPNSYHAYLNDAIRKALFSDASSMSGFLTRLVDCLKSEKNVYVTDPSLHKVSNSVCFACTKLDNSIMRKVTAEIFFTACFGEHPKHIPYPDQTAKQRSETKQLLTNAISKTFNPSDDSDIEDINMPEVKCSFIVLHRGGKTSRSLGADLNAAADHCSDAILKSIDGMK